MSPEIKSAAGEDFSKLLEACQRGKNLTDLIREENLRGGFFEEFESGHKHASLATGHVNAANLRLVKSIVLASLQGTMELENIQLNASHIAIRTSPVTTGASASVSIIGRNCRDIEIEHGTIVRVPMGDYIDARVRVHGTVLIEVIFRWTKIEEMDFRSIVIPDL